MLAVYFIYGLAFFSLGLAVSCEIRRSSDLPLGRQLPWLAAFGFAHSTVEWIDMFLLVQPSHATDNVLLVARTVLLPVSALLLIRFGAGLIGELGPLPDWVTMMPVAVLVPLTMVTAYALVIIATGSQTATKADVWSRYLLYFPGGLLAAFGFARHGHSLSRTVSRNAHNLLMGAGIAFALYAITAGLIVPKSPYGISAWLNYDAVNEVTHLPLELWRALVALTVMILVMRALGVFEAERRQEFEALRTEREQAHAKALVAQRDARQTAERWIEALVLISRQIATLDPLDVVLAQIVDCARVFLGADAAALALWDEDYTHLIVKAFAGPTQGEVLGQVVRMEVILEAARARRTEMFPRDFDQHCALMGARIHSGLIAPLAFEDETLGALWAVSKSVGAFDRIKLDRLGHLSDQAVIAIQHALMATRLQSLAAIEERSRIAREMHDGLAQILGYLNLELQTLEALVRQGQAATALEELAKARGRISVAQADVRENILSLRTTLASDAGLIPALHEYIQEFTVQTGIAADLVINLSGAPPLSPMAETQLVRIVQEALANVRKHSKAIHVQTRMAVRGGCLRVTITDDGIGFELGTRRGKFGVQTMRERAESVGGGLTITSQLGRGTQVVFWLPLMQR